MRRKGYATGFALVALLAFGASGAADGLGSQPTFTQVLELLRASPAGAALLRKATLAWNLKPARQSDPLASHLRWGEVSRTDAVLIRHYDPDTGRESRERKVTVDLRAGQPMQDTVLDLAHELVHATSRPSWDPYDPSLTAGQYIRAAIEGAGGEVEAVSMECEVGRELYGPGTGSDPGLRARALARCGRYWVPDGKRRILSDFYRSGKWAAGLRRRLGAEAALFPLLSSQAPELYSSTGGTPYPAALFEEYREMTATACRNSRERAAVVAEGSEPGRSPASGLSEFLARRCSP